MIGKTILPEIDALILSRDVATLKEVLSDLPSPDIAELLGDIPERDQAVIFRLLSKKVASETFEYLDVDTQESLLKALGREEVATILNEMHPDDRTALLEELPPNVVKDTIALLSAEERKIAQTLLGYPEDSVGRLMTPDYIAVRKEWTVKEVLDFVREKGKDSETLNVIYVVDETGRLIDDVRIREILLSPLERKVSELMNENFIALRPTDDQETAVNTFSKYSRVALPVVAESGHLLGIVTVDDVLTIAEEEHTEDIQKFGGLEALDEPYLQKPGGPDITIRHVQTLAAGLAAVWATDNTREALWDALGRKEVYATTGTRMTVRVFAGWDFEAADVQRPDFAKTGYLRGVPMGGDLTKAHKGKAPTFVIRALRDVDGANLDRIQIIKGWLDAKGATQEQVYDVFCSDDRKITDKHRCDKPVGNTVDIKKATYTNSIGDALMLAYWKDPAFDPKQRAFYYIRVLEIPTPRWTTYDAAFFGVELPKDVPASHQERAYTSPIWYTP